MVKNRNVPGPETTQFPVLSLAQVKKLQTSVA